MLNIYLIVIGVMSLLTFILFAVDKSKSKSSGSSRIPEIVLLSALSLGGGVGGIFGIYALRHKSNFKAKFHFAITLVVSLIAQILVLIYLIQGVITNG